MLKTKLSNGGSPDSRPVGIVTGPATCGGADDVDAIVRLIDDELASRWPGGADRLDAICRYALMPAGKLFRPRLVVESTLAVGGEIEQVLPIAIGSECGHTASLIHDDIIDSDELRRGRASTYHKFGTENAIIAGDTLIFHLFMCLAECRRVGVPAERIVAALEIAAAAGIDMCRGQSMEAEITENFDHDIDRYLRMIELKSSALFRSACQSGAVIGGGTGDWVEALGEYGKHLGIAFQIIDDLFAYTGDSETIGKQTTSDVRNRRLTLPILLAYQSGAADEGRLLDRVFSGALNPAEALAEVTGALERTGALEASREIARRHAAAAKDALIALPATPSRERLGWFADHAVKRVS